MIEKFDFLEESEPRICLWCRHGLLLLGNEQDGERIACLWHARDESRQPKVMKPLPPNVSARTWTPVFNSDEHRDCFQPTKRGTPKMRLLEKLGYVNQ